MGQSLLLAIILNFFFPGLGLKYYTDDYETQSTIMVALSCCAFMLNITLFGALLGMPLWFGLMIWSMVILIIASE